jgi:hypothetical protein
VDSKKYEIFRPDEMPSIDRGNGARTIPLVNAQAGAEDFLNGTECPQMVQKIIKKNN